MKKIALAVAGLTAIFVTLNLKDKIERWVRDREAESLASKAFSKILPIFAVFSDIARPFLIPAIFRT